MFGKSYFALGEGEKGVVDNQVLLMLGANYAWLTPERLFISGACPTLNTCTVVSCG